MRNAEWITKRLFSEGPGRRGIVAFSLVGWLLMVALIAKIFLGCSANLRQAVMSYEPQSFKIEASAFDTADSPSRIKLPSYGDNGLAFLENDIFNDDLNACGPSCDVSALASIGQPLESLSASLAPVKKDASMSRSALLNPIINRAAAQYQVDPALVRAIIFAESGYNPAAVSKRGAIGLMQLMPGTAKAMGVEDCFDPEHNIYGGVKYFKKLFNQFNGDVKLALAAYNAGSRKVRQFNGVPPFKATEHYIQKVLKYYKIYKGQQTEPIGLS